MHVFAKSHGTATGGGTAAAGRGAASKPASWTIHIRPKPGGAWSGFPSEPLEKKLLENKDFLAMGLVLVKDATSADLLITLERPTMSWDCSYRMTHEETGVILGAGKAIAWDCIRAAPDIASQIVKRLKQLREPNPVTPQPAKKEPKEKN
jgi:hypothetical protein